MPKFKTIITNLEKLKMTVSTKNFNPNEDKAIIDRIYQHDCTVGVMLLNNFRCFTLELPNLGNEQNVSCIPVGSYQCKKINSPSLGDCIEISDVVGRSYVRIHAGNYTRQIRGCVLVGDSLKDIDKDGVIDVTNSKSTLKNLMRELPDEFYLEIR